MQLFPSPSPWPGEVVILREWAEIVKDARCRQDDFSWWVDEEKWEIAARQHLLVKRSR